MAQFKYLIKVEPGANNNKFIKMNENADGTFTSTADRVGAPNPRMYPPKSMNEWNSYLGSKLRKGYEDKTELFAEVKTALSSGGVVATDTEVANFIIMLQGYAQAQTAQTYLVAASSVTQKQIDEAQRYIDELSNMAKKFNRSNWSTNAFNYTLLELFKVIPRKMKQVQDHLINDSTTKSELEELLNNEQSNLDSMAGQVVQNISTADDTNKQHTLLESLGLKLALVTDSKVLSLVKDKAENHRHKVRRVFAVENTHTQVAFNNKLKSAKDKKTEIFWHGSRRQNWWFILQQGLKIRPSGAVHTGSMFSDGVYFAREADKSMGYTDGGRWTGSGGSGHVYMALYEVHVGKQMIINQHDSSCYNLNKTCPAKGYDSVWAKKGVSLYRDEYVIYDAAQSTIRYIVEFNN